MLPASAHAAHAGRAARNAARNSKPATDPLANTIGANPAGTASSHATGVLPTTLAVPDAGSANSGSQHHVTRMAGLEYAGKRQRCNAWPSLNDRPVASIADTIATAPACESSRMKVKAASAASAPLKP